MPGNKDQRYKAIKSLIETKRITGLEEIFTIIPLSVVRADMQVNYSTLRNRIYNPETLTLRDFSLMADLFDVDPTDIFSLAVAEMNAKKKSVARKYSKK